ncbi:MAG: hypothetical protein EXS08_14435, partial [Planctomycetes bacterium]|nr:hypothetical protein [Planctomycetota bacterium]
MPTRLLASSSVFLALALTAAAQVPTTATDFQQPGTQPGGLSVPIFSHGGCTFCHGFFDERQEPYERWSGGMMANAMRDPVFHAALTIANQDLGDAGALCLRCHTPGGFLAGRTTPADGSALNEVDYQGVNCHFCHRLVDPLAAAENPSVDTAILAGLAAPPADAHGGQFVVDPNDRRRGPFNLGVTFFYHQWLESPFHRESLLCATCHEVSNPAFVRVGGATPSASDSYALDTLGAQHPTHAKTDEFPLERTFTEWSLSDFAAGPIEMGGRFGGDATAVSSCQDCHMPTTSGTACALELGNQNRPDVPQHDFSGANSWVPLAIYSLDGSLALYPESHMNGQPLFVFQDAIARNAAMLRAASDLALTRAGNDLVARITNQSGHKLPSGYAEGRRMWLNVKFYARKNLLAERGHYDY